MDSQSPVVDPPPPPPPPLPPGVACVACGYDLRGLVEVENCPECGTPISFSVRGDFYRFGDPDRVGRMALGAVVVMVTLIVAIPGYIGLTLLDGMVGNGGARRGTVIAIGSALWVLAHAAGWWILSASEPNRWIIDADGPEPLDRGERARVWLRETLVVFVAVSLGAIGMGMWRAAAWGSPTAFMPGRKLAAALWLATMVACVGVVLMGLRHIMAMSRRVPPGGLGLRAEFFFLLIATLSAMMAISAGVGAIMNGLGMADAIDLLSKSCACISAPLWIFALAGVMFTTSSLATALRREQKLAVDLRLGRGGARSSLR